MIKQEPQETRCKMETEDTQIHTEVSTVTEQKVETEKKVVDPFDIGMALKRLRDAEEETQKKSYKRAKWQLERKRIIKKPRSAWTLFTVERMASFASPASENKIGAVTKSISQEWKNMTPEQKAPYQKLYLQDKLQYEQKKENLTIIDKKILRECNKKRRESRAHMPRAPLSSYMFFYLEQQHIVRNSHPEWKITEIGKHVGQMWKELTDEQRSKYVDEATKERLRYRQQLESMDKKHRVQPIVIKEKKKKQKSREEKT